jgi:hypothetical protein
MKLKKKILIIVLAFSFVNINAQIILTDDTSFCSPQPYDLHALSSIQSSMATDDLHDGVVPIGFNFDFYGGTYDKCVVSGNGYITFDTSVANTGSPWVIGTAIPNPGQMPENAIMAPWQDINTGVVGNIYYGTTGVAPNRRFTVTWCSIAMFSCTQMLHTSQVVMYEGSNKIEMYIKDKPLCTTWNGGAAIQGLVDATSTNFDIVFDPLLLQSRNFPLQWTATNEGWEFIPNGTTAYNINAIPYVPIVAGVANWFDATGNIIGTGPTITVNPTNTTTYYCEISGACIDSTITNLDSVTVSITGCFDVNLSSAEASCLGTDGTITSSLPPNVSTSPWLIELKDFNGTNIQVANNVMSTTYTFSNVVVGPYIVKLTDGLGFSSQDTISVFQIPNPLSVSTNHQDVKCYDGSDGVISVIPTGGALPYSFFKNGVLTTNAYPYDSVFANLSAGTYIMSVVDDNSCMNKDTVVIDAPKFPLQAKSQSKIVACYGSSDSYAVGSASGGSPGYSYEWFDDTYTSFSLNDTAFGLSSGSYYLEVMDANGCDTFTSVQVISPQTSLTGNPQIFGVLCKGDSTGMLVGDAGGSWAPYRYYWFNSLGDTIQDSGVRLGRDTLSGLVAGSYDLHVYDSRDCFVNYSLLVGEPSTSLSIDSMAVITSNVCYGDSVGAARLYASGGMPNYTYSWSSGHSTLIASDLKSGYHSVVLSDDWGCEVVDSIYVPENPEIVSELGVVQNASCYGYNDGSCYVTSVGGVPSYTYFWSNGHTGFSMPDTASGLLHGSYYVTTRDILGCEVVDSIYISEPLPLSMEASELDWIDCYGAADGLAYATASGGTLPYTFSWDNGTWIGDTISSLTSGLHTVVVTDEKGCTASDTVFIHEPTELLIAIDESQTILAYCIGVNTASLTSLASGGTPGYSYEWNDNVVNPQTTPVATSLLAGVYTVTVTDSKGCTASATSDIDTLTNTMDAQVNSLVQYIGGNDVSCFGEDDGSAFVLAWGAHAPYTYQWYGPSGFTSVNDSIFDLVAGTYSVTIRDTNDCMINRSIVMDQPDQLYFTTLGSVDESCLGACNGEVLLSANGGELPYTGIATDNVTGSVLSTLMTTDSVFAGVCSGDYTISLTDVNGCSSQLINGGVDQQVVGYGVSTSANINPSTITNVLCNGSATGSLGVLNPNMNAGYSYSWENVSNPGVVISTSTQVNNLVAGTYVLSAHYADADNLGQNYAGCTTTDTVTITELMALSSLGSVTAVDCYGNATGSISISQITGGTSPYAMQWNPGGQNTNLTAGTYTLTITDANTCSEVDTFEVTEPQALSASITKVGYVLTASTPNGGVSPYSYSWRESSLPMQQIGTGMSYTVTNYGDYYVLVTDANGCVTESNSFTFDDVSGLDGNLLPELSIYPNPFRDATTVDFGRVVSSVDLRLVDVYGKLIEEYSLVEVDKYLLKRDRKAAGIYFLEIEMEGNEKLVYKLIID